MTTIKSMAQRAAQPAWSSLSPGTAVVVVKLAPDGAEAARYDGEVVARRQPGNWAIVRARWTYRQIDLDELAFVPDDVLLEWFSPELPFNAFAIFSPQGEFRGWYANVAYPAKLSGLPNDGAEPVLTWHDLYLDLVALPDGRCTLRDEDELRQAGLSSTDPLLHAAIESAAAEMKRRLAAAELPFVAQDELRALLDKAELPSNQN